MDLAIVRIQTAFKVTELKRYRKNIDQKLVMGGKKIETTVVVGVFNIFVTQGRKV